MDIQDFDNKYISDYFLFKTNIEKIKHLKKMALNKNDEDFLKFYFFLFEKETSIEVKREIASSIGRHNNNDKKIYFIKKNVFNNFPLDIVAQFFRTLLKDFDSNKYLIDEILKKYKNEYLDQMFLFKKNLNKNTNHKEKNLTKKNTKDYPILLKGDAKQKLKLLKNNSVHLVFTSPPYYNAKEYSNYINYKEYLNELKKIFFQIHKKLKPNRYLIINSSPVIMKRAGREFNSKRYPIPFDIHNVINTLGFEYVDDIYWVKPSPSSKNRIGGFEQFRKPLMYKPNSITEHIMVYRKISYELTDSEIKKYPKKIQEESRILGEYDKTNLWFIAPSSSKDHPAIFPKKLCEKIIKYYSYKGDIVLDPFAGSGTFGEVAMEYKRIPILIEIKREYHTIIKNRIPDIKVL